MQNSEFKIRLEHLRTDVAGALAYYAAWHSLHLHDPSKADWTLDRLNQLLGRWRGFFSPIGFAVQGMAMLSFAKLFDADPRSASFLVLLREAKSDPSLIPHAGPNDLAEIDACLARVSETRKIITRLRNERLAHTDVTAGQLPSLMSQRVEALAEDVKFLFNKLSVAHENKCQSWDEMLRETETHTTSILSLLSNEIDHQQLEFDQTMVEIGLGHIQEIESVLGRRLSEDDVRLAISTLGLTPPQSERVLELNQQADVP